ncbi:molybdopterin-dependent oxidoreductase [Sphingomonas sp. Root710]|uniref:molybdopterin-containing oxidoreductase family protein n=1 Tax=Sphingomonas sp. Root710 TaxID=1736594 RepID=UPI001F22DB40|nr:molybdopterin-dependent oxidoreductase [Sphingomonas sp. Root710]
MYDPARELFSTRRMPDGSRVRIGVDDAIDEIVAKLRDVIARHGPDSVAMYVGTASSKSVPLIPLSDSFLEAIGATRGWSANTLDQPGKQIAHGLHGYWMAPSQSFDNPEVILWIGINPAMTYTGLPCGSPKVFMRDQLRKGTRIIMIDPRAHDTARRCTMHIQPRPGHDVAIMAGLIRIILSEKLHDQAFVAENVEGLDALRAAVEPFTPALVAERADIAAEDLVKVARIFAQAKRGYVVAGTGPSMGTAQGTLFEYLVLALDTICGHYLRAGEEVITPGTLEPVPAFKAQAHGPIQAFGYGPRLRFRGFTDTLGGLPVSAMAEEILTPGEGQVRALFVVGGNPATAVTDQLQMLEALGSLELLVTTDIQMSATAKLSHYNIAPTMHLETAAIRGDKPPTGYANSYAGSLAPFAHYTPALVEPPPGSDVIEEWELYYRMAQRMGVQLRLNPMRYYTTSPPPKIRREPPAIDMTGAPTTDDIIALMTARARIPLDEVKRHPSGALFPPDTPVIVQPKDAGWTEKFDLGNPLMMRDLAEAFETIDVARDLAEGHAFRLMCRRQHQLNSSLQIPAVDRGKPGNPAYMHSTDMARLGIADGDLVEISSSRSAIPAVAMTDDELRPGTVSMAQCFGDTPEFDDRVREIGSCTNRLLWNDRVYERYSGQPLMSNVPVNVKPIIKTGPAYAEPV